MSSIPINYTFTETSTITSMKIEITQLILFSSCQFRVYLFDKDGIQTEILIERNMKSLKCKPMPET